MSSKGVVVDMGGKPIRHAFRAREGWWWAGNPPVSRFEQGRGGVGRETLLSRGWSEGGAVLGGNPIRLAFRAREGWWWEETPSVLRFRQGRGGVGQETLP